ncbi:RNA ligase family protein [Mesorhizobium sp. M7A.F.Ca.CA.004.02.1.1]|uniref:RNA ligase family protein n=1 Tax=Mesorhizobium sp. M7A.F.Ca.CA.004.02.1.1 TaxID=2496690 RepID=UPI000FCB8461|nr:RNA ligase family protein [Mesorhizobium sp. M7A.F.Ca.CA.004.02.1.1]RVB02840.1 hypothetical protein EN912_10335 [Mesorhizobium sp. M7A.F.Ca.CA.004.02.1.1]
MSVFTPFPKLSRLNSSCVITEKLDGTNAQIVITPTVEADDVDPTVIIKLALDDQPHVTIRAGSRSRWITPGKATDNYGFAGWVQSHAIELSGLGLGHHFGEWYGNGIQIGYGLDEKRFALFNTDRWGTHNPNTPAICHVVPVLHRGAFSDEAISDAMHLLHDNGSVAVPGFMKPEGIVTYVHSARSLFKKTFEHDTGKWRAAA